MIAVDGFLERRRQRRLVHWALACVAAAFALIQVPGIVAQRFGWPEATVRFAPGEYDCTTDKASKS